MTSKKNNILFRFVKGVAPRGMFFISTWLHNPYLRGIEDSTLSIISQAVTVKGYLSSFTSKIIVSENGFNC